MAGILQQAQQAAAPNAPVPTMPPQGAPVPMEPDAQMPPQGAEAPEAVDDLNLPGREQATAEEQEAFERGRAVGLKLLSKKGTLDRIINAARTRGPEGVAEMIAMAVVQIDERMDLPETVIMQVATELAGFVLDAAERARVLRADEETTNKVMSAVYSALAEAYGQSPIDAAEVVTEMSGAGGQREIGNGLAQ